MLWILQWELQRDNLHIRPSAFTEENDVRTRQYIYIYIYYIYIYIYHQTGSKKNYKKWFGRWAFEVYWNKDLIPVYHRIAADHRTLWPCNNCRTFLRTCLIVPYNWIRASSLGGSTKMCWKPVWATSANRKLKPKYDRYAFQISLCRLDSYCAA